MRRKTLLMTLLMLIGFSMANAMEVEVGTLEANKLTNQFPTNPYFAYSLSQQIYSAGELGGTAGSITSISFYRDWTSETIDELKMSGLKLYMLMTTKTQFDSETDMVPVTDADLVWQGTLSAPAVDYKGWVTVNLDKPFQYDGLNNLLVCFYDDNPQKTVNNTNKFYYNATSANTALTYFGNDVAPDLENLGEYAGNKLAMSAHNYAKFQIGNYRRVEIIDNTTNGQFPTYTNYNYSLSQQIYTTDEVGSSKTLNSISFRNIGEEKTRVINLYLVQTDKTEFDADDDFIPFTNANMVFSGEVTFGNTDWTTIEFDIPFAYSGVQNLAVIMADNSGHYEGSASFLAYYAPNLSIMSYTDTEPVTLSNFNVYGSYRGLQKNRVRFNEGKVIGEKTDMALPTNPVYKYSLTQQLFAPSEMGYSSNSIASISFFNTGDGEDIRYLDVYLKHTTKTLFADGTDGETVTESDKVFSGYVTIKSNDWTSIRFDEYFEYNGSDNLLVVVNDKTGKDSGVDVMWLVKDASSQSLNSHSDSGYDPSSVYNCNLLDAKNQVLFNDKGLSFKPTNVSATDIVWNGATISWEGRGSKWNLRYKAEGTEEWTVIEDITENPYQLTGLEQETLYLIEVQGNDNGDLSDWSDRTSFKTSEQYPKPTDLEVMEVTPYSAIVRWTDNCSATAWEIEAYYSYGSETKFVTEAGSNPFVLTGLHPGVTYNIFVRSVIDAENGIYGNWSSYVTFTTPESNPAPGIMAVEPTPGGANIAWEGESDRYIVRYRKPTPPPSVYYFNEDFESITTEGELPEGWTAIDADGDGFNWKSTQTSGYKYHSGNSCLYSESFDNNTSLPLTPDNWLITPQLELKGTLSAWLAGQDSSWPSEHFAIYVSTAGTDIADFVEVLPEEVATSDYVEYTVDLSAYEGQQGYIAFRHFNVTDMFKLNLDDVSIYEPVEPYPWVTAETTDKTFTISGLEYDETYEVEVLGVKKGNENSSSGLYPFTTLVKNPAPYDIVVNALGTTADVKWTGYSEMYEVRYRTVQEVASFSDDFESGDLTTNGWTVYTDDEYVSGHDGWYVSTYGAYAGSYSVGSYSWTNSDGALNADNWLITPLVDLNGTLAYWEWANSTYRDSYEVLLSTTGNAEADFTEVLRPFGPSEAAGGWLRTQIDLSAYEGQQGYIAFHHKDYDNTRILIDDVKIFETSYGATVTKYVTKPEIALKDLTPGTQYEIQVIGQMSGEAEAPSEPVIFTTATSDPIEVKFDNYADNTVDISSKIGVLANVTIENLALPDGQWVPVCLPFDLDVASSPFTEARLYQGYEMAGSTMIVDFTTPVSYMYAGYPYLVKVDRGDGGNLVDPVFKAVTISGAYNYYVYDYLYFYNANYYQLTCTMDYPAYFHVTDNGRKLESLYDTCILQAFEPYFYFGGDLSSFNEILLNTGDNDYVTGIETIDNGQLTMDNVIYNVAGQRLGKMQKGINIVNGKKVLVK